MRGSFLFSFFEPKSLLEASHRLAANVLRLTEGGFCKRLVCSRFLLAAVSWCVSMWAGSVCFCSFLRGEGNFNQYDYQAVTK